MDQGKLIRQLVPKSVHFDGYNLVGCKGRDSPFFGENAIPMGDYTFSVRQINNDTVSLIFQSVCKEEKIRFLPYLLTFEMFKSKLKKAVKTGSDFISFEIKPAFETSINSCTQCSTKSRDCTRMMKNKDHPETVFAAVSFDIDDIRRAFPDDYRMVNTNNKDGGRIKMKNSVLTTRGKSFMGVNFEFGRSKDPNLAMSPLGGFAVRDPNGGAWYTYDGKNHKNLANCKMDLPIFLVPVTSMQPGDLIKKNTEYFWIKEITPNGTFKAIGALDGQVHEILATESLIPGLNLYTKVVSIMDTKSLTDPSGHNMAGNFLSAMLLMQWSKNDGKAAEFSLDDIDDNSFNEMGGFLPLILAQSRGGNISSIFGGENGQLNLPMLMMLGGGADSDESGFMQMYVLSQLLSGGNGNTGLEGLIPGINTQQKPTASVVGVATGNDVICDKCDITFPEGTNFCPFCGVKTHPVGEYCKKCGTQLMPGALFCHKCGTKIGPTTCPNCKIVVPEDAAFCPKCGKPLKEANVVTLPAPTDPKEEIQETPVEQKNENQI